MIEHALNITDEEVKLWFQDQELLFCHVATRVTMGDEHKYNQVNYLPVGQHCAYIEQSQAHFAKYNSVLHKSKLEYTYDGSAVISPRDGVNSRNPAAGSQKMNGDWRVSTDEIRPPEACQDSGDSRSTADKDNDYYKILVDIYPYLANRNLDSIAHCETFGDGLQSTGFGMAVFYVLGQSDKGDSDIGRIINRRDLAERVFTKCLSALFRELLKLVQEKNKELERLSRENARNAEAFDIIQNSYEEFDSAIAKLTALKTDVSAATSSSCIRFFDADFCRSEMIDELFKDMNLEAARSRLESIYPDCGITNTYHDVGNFENEGDIKFILKCLLGIYTGKKDHQIREIIDGAVDHFHTNPFGKWIESMIDAADGPEMTKATFVFNLFKGCKEVALTQKDDLIPEVFWLPIWTLPNFSHPEDPPVYLDRLQWSPGNGNLEAGKILSFVSILFHELVYSNACLTLINIKFEGLQEENHRAEYRFETSDNFNYEYFEYALTASQGQIGRWRTKIFTGAHRLEDYITYEYEKTTKKLGITLRQPI